MIKAPCRSQTGGIPRPLKILFQYWVRGWPPLMRRDDSGAAQGEKQASDEEGAMKR